ncbi:betaine/proline/choline family ABC transporter ATP-binding protein [Dorea formicigenerans]
MIEIKNVTKIYDGIRAVNQLNLTVRDGEIFVLLGSSGCGKSTTLNMINRLIEPTEGNIYIDGKDIKDFKPEILRRSIGYVVQGTGLFPNMTVGQNIGIVPKMLKWNSQEIKRRVKELLEMIGLDPDKYVKKYPHQLSGGEAQRIGVARALAANPGILLMDEPFGAVDPINRANLQNEFMKLQKKLHTTVVLVTHDIGEAMKMGDRIALMDQGKLQGVGTPRELLCNKDNQFICEFMGNDSYINILNCYTVKEYIQPMNIQSGIHISETCNLKDAMAKMIENAVNVLDVTNDQGIVYGQIAINQLIHMLKKM